MESIAKPNKIEFLKGEKPNEAVVTVEPFYPGYGMTIGNSIRRVLLSSLLGTAVVGVKINGASHEFTTLPYVKEDILEIIMNLKQLKLAMFDEDEIKLELDARGKKEVKAGDIKKDSRAEVVNPDLVIANITDNAGSLSMEITIGKGRGYRPVESIEKKNTEVGFIETDAFFSPVLAVGLKVENVRVGKMTNWDKLIINITTDGTISPEKAFNDSVKVLQEQINALLGEAAPALAEEAKVEEAKEEAVVEEGEKKPKKSSSAKAAEDKEKKPKKSSSAKATEDKGKKIK
ncbi:MAG TPA: DNA-directed RNA polymerase subunit alpha [Candidatus Nanoarchaeia archaeon]|nr:DNA-directed RNA polymerase subunit alpha [Candidatus Nanoarchaeia archaeon]